MGVSESELVGRYGNCSGDGDMDTMAEPSRDDFLYNDIVMPHKSPPVVLQFYYI